MICKWVGGRTVKGKLLLLAILKKLTQTFWKALRIKKVNCLHFFFTANMNISINMVRLYNLSCNE